MIMDALTLVVTTGNPWLLPWRETDLAVTLMELTASGSTSRAAIRP
jgi:hypothetical protein